jgi:REP element-mobilizing transposase RayT
MSDPLAYLITWTTYGTWVHGDDRGWVKSGDLGIKPADHRRAAVVRERMTDEAVLLSPAQREIVESTIRQHCEVRKWPLLALNVRTNHIHLVVTASGTPEAVMSQLKAWCSRRLSEHAGLVGRAKNGQRRWWTEHGSTKYINDEAYLHNATRYVNERQ